MVKSNRVVASITTLMLVLAIPFGDALGQSKVAKQIEPFDPVDFIKSFRIGMSYVEVQGALPKTAEQDILAYISSEEAFLLGVDMPGGTTWSASFKFDTLDTPARRPEQLIEFSCIGGLTTRSESFETIVRKVTAAFGEPVEINRSQERFQQAGWRVSGGSLLTLEYSTMPGAGNNNLSIEFVIKKNPRKRPSDSNAVA
ncbi:MAG: hypothetical protein WAV20_02810 [Blastocatellia bacterium]